MKIAPVVLSLATLLVVSCSGTTGGVRQGSGELLGAAGQRASQAGSFLADAGKGLASGIKKGVNGGVAAAQRARTGSFASNGSQLPGPSFSDIPTDQVPHTLMRKPVATGRLSSDFGRRRNPTSWIGFPKFHNGIDYAAAAGTAVYAAGDGEVIEKRVSDSYGNVLKIKHENGFETLYAHLSGFESGIEVGTVVTRGQPIGGVGNTGRSTAAHLHYELIYRGKRVNPLFVSSAASVKDS